MERRNFVVMFVGGAGSTYLTEMLRAHPDVIMRDEILAPLSTAAEQTALLRDYLGQAASKARGFKTKIFDVRDPDSFLATMAAFDPRFFRLTRANIVKHAVALLRSREVARRSREAFGRPFANLRASKLDEHPELALGAIDIEPERLLRRIERVEERQVDLDRFLGRCTDVVPVVYEDLLRDPQATFDRVCNAVGVAPIPVPTTDVIKNTPDDLSQAIANFAECRAALSGTAYEAMLLEGVGPPR